MNSLIGVQSLIGDEMARSSDNVKLVDEMG